MQEAKTADLASLGRTLAKGLDKIILDEQVASLALPFIGSGKASAVAATAPFLIKHASTFLKVPQTPQSLKVLPKAAACKSMQPGIPSDQKASLPWMLPDILTHACLVPPIAPRYCLSC